MHSTIQFHFLQTHAHTAAVIGFEERVYNGSESEGEIQVVVAVLQGELSVAPVSVRLFTTDATALSSQDYDSVNQTLTFSSNSTRIPVSVLIEKDSVKEDKENFTCSLILESDSSQIELTLDPNTATVFIVDSSDDDGERNSSCSKLLHGPVVS